MIIKKFKDIPLEYGYRISHKLTEEKYPSGKIATFYVVKIMKGTHEEQYLEWIIAERN